MLGQLEHSADPGATVGGDSAIESARLTRQAGNTNKLDIAITLLRAVRSVALEAIVLLDSWYMRQKVIRHATGQGYGVIGQVRKDTALYACPVLSEQRQRGRPRRYGEKYTANSMGPTVWRHYLSKGLP